MEIVRSHLIVRCFKFHHMVSVCSVRKRDNNGLLCLTQTICLLDGCGQSDCFKLGSIGSVGHNLSPVPEKISVQIKLYLDHFSVVFIIQYEKLGLTPHHRGYGDAANIITLMFSLSSYAICIYSRKTQTNLAKFQY